MSLGRALLPSTQASGRTCSFACCPPLAPELSELVCALVRLYGDESELHFWTVASHYLHSLSQEKAPTELGRINDPLDICYDILCENTYFQVPGYYCRLPTWPQCLRFLISFEKEQVALALVPCLLVYSPFRFQVRPQHTGREGPPHLQAGTCRFSSELTSGFWEGDW